MQHSLIETPEHFRINDFIKKIVKFSVPSWVGFFINIVSVFIMTRYFMPDDYGLINTFNASSTLVMGLVCLGLDSGFMRYFYESPEGFDRKSLFFVTVLIPCIILLAISATVLAFMPMAVSVIMFGIEHHFLLVLLFGNVIALVVVRFVTVFYRMEGNSLLFSVLSIAMQLALKGSLVFAALIKPTFEFAILSMVLTTLLMIAVFLFFYGKALLPYRGQLSLTKIPALKNLFVYSLYTWPIPLLLYFNVLATLILIRMRLGNEAVGIFTSVNVFVGLITVLQAGFSTFWSGFMFANYKTQEKLIIRIHDYLALFINLIMIGFILFRELIFLVLGAQYHVSKPFFALLLIYPLLLIFSETTGYGISIAKKTYLMFIFTLVSIILNLGGTYLLLPHMGLLGVCMASSLSAIFLFAFQSYYSQKYYCSIANAGRTIFTVISVAVLALGNLVLSNNIWGLTIFSVIFLILVGFVYRKEISEIIAFSKISLSKAV